jgi:ribonuclease P protein component
LQRLKTKAQFQAVMGGSTLARTPHFALHQTGLGHARPAVGAASLADASVPLLFPVPAVWMGAQVPKRWARRAVTRNTIKRQIYSVCSDFESRLDRAAHVVRLRAVFDRARFVSATSDQLKHAVRDELLQLFERATRQTGSQDGRESTP